MSKQRVTILVILGALLLLWMLPTPFEKKLLGQFTALSETAAIVQPLNPFEARIKAKELSDILAGSVFINYQSPDEHFKRSFKRREALDSLTAALSQLRYLKVGFSRFHAEKTPSGTAKVSLFMVAEWKVPGEEQLSRAAEDTRLVMERIDGDWQITHIETLPR